MGILFKLFDSKYGESNGNRGNENDRYLTGFWHGLYPTLSDFLFPWSQRDLQGV